MQADQFRLVREAAETALAVPESRRVETLERLLGDRPRLCAEALALLEASEAAGSFLEVPLVARHGAIGRDPGMLRAPGPDLSGREIGRYRLLRQVGSGGMGAVYLAIRSDGEFRKPVALKLAYRYRSSFDGELKRRFLDERQILASLEHPGIARLHDGGTFDGFPYLVMEYVDGKPIDAYCRENGCSLATRLAIVAKVSDALAYAHSKLVVHRDIKPQNILVTADGEPKLLDFGVAKVLSDDAAQGTAGESRSHYRPLTPFYASPEQLRGEPVTPASDIYSLGVVLYRLITGDFPRRPDSLSRDAVEACLGQTPSPASRYATVIGDSSPAGRWYQSFLRWHPLRADRDLDAVTRKALAADAERRYNAAEHLGADLRRFLDGRPVSARRSTLRYRTARFVRRHRLASSLGLLALVALGDLSSHSLRQASEIVRQRDRAVEESRRARETFGLLIELLEEADPLRTGAPSRGERPLALAADRVRRRLHDYPLEQARLLDTAGAVNDRIGYPQEALPLLVEAQALYEREGSGGLEAARNLLHLGQAHISIGEYGPAAELLRAALGRLRDIDGTSDAIIAETLRGLGEALFYDGKITEAERAMREAVETLRGRRGLERGFAAALNGLGEVMAGSRGAVAATPFHIEALSLQRRALGPDHPALARTLILLARSLEEAGNLAAAQEKLSAALRIREEAYGKQSALVGETLLELSRVLRRKSDLAASEAALERGCTLLEAGRGRDHRDVGSCLHGFGLLRLADGDLDGAEALLQRTLSWLHENDAPAHHRAFPLRHLAVVAERRRDHSTAETHLRECLRLLGDLPSVAPTLVEIRAALERVAAARGEPQLQLRRSSIESKITG